MITAEEYWNGIAKITKDLEQRYIENDITDIYEAINETVDSHEWFIYNSYHFDVLQHSENENYGLEAGVINTNFANAVSLFDITSAFVFWAMYGDILDNISDIEELDTKRDEYLASQATA